jgi:hypothetical protein
MLELLMLMLKAKAKARAMSLRCQPSGLRPNSEECSDDADGAGDTKIRDSSRDHVSH